MFDVIQIIHLPSRTFFKTSSMSTVSKTFLHSVLSFNPPKLYKYCTFVNKHAACQTISLRSELILPVILFNLISLSPCPCFHGNVFIFCFSVFCVRKRIKERLCGKEALKRCSPGTWMSSGKEEGV